MPIAHLYIPKGDRGVIIPVDEVGDGLAIVDYFNAAGGEFSVLEQPETRTDITPAYWSPEDSRFTVETKRNINAAKIHIEVGSGLEGYLMNPREGRIGSLAVTRTIHIPAHGEVLIICRQHRTEKIIRPDLYDIGGALVYLPADEMEMLGEVMPRSDRHA